MLNYYSRFLNNENFFLAFKKLKGYLCQANEWYDPVELAAYEANLPSHITRIIEEVKEGQYQTKPIEPLPFPKKKNKESGEESIRPYYNVHIDDQLIWIAIINVIGAEVESQMPFWSYGNRLYRPVWFEINEQTGKPELMKGSYNNASSNFYRKWNQSWPLYRNHISMTIKVMGYSKGFQTSKLSSEKEIDLFQQERDSNFEIEYLDKAFWGANKNKDLYWIGLDFEKFFPSINKKIVLESLTKILSYRDDVSVILQLLPSLLEFRVNTEGWNDLGLLQNIDSEGKLINGLPTGLFVSGFLANAALIDVDNRLNEWIRNNKSVAIFKYVDDQIILAKSKKSLLNFLDFYHDLLKGSGCDVSFKEEKIEPKDAFDYCKEKGFTNIGKDKNVAKLDIEYPEPLMTHTLIKMSNINNEDYEFYDDNDLDEAQNDLEHFLIADFPDSEMRKETRMAFAAMKLCQLAKYIKPDFTKIDPTLERNIRLAKEEFQKLEKYKKGNNSVDSKTEAKEVRKILERAAITNFQREYKLVVKKQSKIFKLLLKAAKENPDKLKLWKRCVQFCFFGDSENLPSVFGEINKLKILDVSKSYLQGYCLLVVQNCLLKAHKNIRSDCSSFWQKVNSWNFIAKVKRSNDTIIGVFTNNQNLPFSQESLSNYKVVSDLILQLNQQVPLELISYFNRSKIKYNGNGTWKGYSYLGADRGNNSKFEKYLWYLLTCFDDIGKENLWEKNVETIDLQTPLSWSILSAFPKKISDKLFDTILTDIYSNVNNADTNKELVDSERYNFSKEGGILYDYFSSREQITQEQISKYPRLDKIFSSRPEGYVQLDEWLDSVVDSSSSKTWVEPRLFEWTFLEIINQIANAIIDENKGNDYLFNTPRSELSKVHPANYLLPKEWLNTGEALTWESWKRTTQDHKIKLTEKDKIINDFRYLPVSNKWQDEIQWLFGDWQISLVIGLAVLLTQLISKSFKWPFTANKHNFIDQLFSRAITSIETEAISSDTRILLGAIFSKKELEIMFGSEVIKLSENTTIKNLEDFQREIHRIQNNLELHHISLKHQQPRQLTYIDIDDLNATTDKFFER